MNKYNSKNKKEIVPPSRIVMIPFIIHLRLKYFVITSNEEPLRVLIKINRITVNSIFIYVVYLKIQKISINL